MLDQAADNKAKNIYKDLLESISITFEDIRFRKGRLA